MHEEAKPVADATTALERIAAAIQRCQRALVERSLANGLCTTASERNHWTDSETFLRKELV